ncbi:putative peptidyl-diphthamide biosynthesis [Naematelia encephala]|uniref:2-(3-amino-3-carboxypropyl)histidine synthase subunit 2 n=1 Tax=Naematelia encephala TaxID=71784 RepID=A0A1Y2ALD6_9TREE|nr:putative peptidyl-diphthamide biosynthesis [Naematelia encephala]
MSELMSTAAQHAFEHPELEAVIPEAGPSRMGDVSAGLSLDEAFEVDSTVRIILEGGYKTIGLQFPDELLPCSPAVFKSIQKKVAGIGAQCYVLADSTYGSCCPDVLSCLHLPADFLVHYGHACLTPTDALPVHYVFPRRSLYAKDAVDKLVDACKEDMEIEGGRKAFIVVWDVSLDWLADEIHKTFTERCSFPISFASIQRPSLKPGPPTVEGEKGKSPALRSIEPPHGLDISDCVILYLGEEGRSLLNLQMTHAGNPLYSYSPSSRSVTPQHPTTSRLLSRRLFALHSAMSSDIFGLVVSSIGLANAKDLLNQLRADLKRAHKKSYTMSVGRLNPAKLANFDAVECFVLVGCNEGGVVDNKDFLRPIITPWELQMALKGPEANWEPDKWTLDMGRVLEAAKEREKEILDNPDDATEDDQDGPEFSLVTGTYRTRKTFGAGNGNGNGENQVLDGVGVQDLTLRNKDFSLAKLESVGSNYLSSREFKGLEQRYGMDEPAILEEGRGGIARGYEEEK